MKSDTPVPARMASFAIGAVVHHRLFDYRGVVIDIDPVFAGGEDWYAQMARSKPPREAPWYHVLVDGAQHQTYVAQRNLEPDNGGKPIVHPLVDVNFAGFVDGTYRPRRAAN